MDGLAQPWTVHHTSSNVCYDALSVSNMTIWLWVCFILPGLRSRSNVGAPGPPAGTCAGKCGYRVWKSWCISSPPKPPGCPGTALFCSLQPERESHCGEGGFLQEQEHLFVCLASWVCTDQIWFLYMHFWKCKPLLWYVCVLPNNTFHTWILYIEGRGNLWLKVLSFSRSVRTVKTLLTTQELTYSHQNSTTKQMRNNVQAVDENNNPWCVQYTLVQSIVMCYWYSHS